MARINDDMLAGWFNDVKKVYTTIINDIPKYKLVKDRNIMVDLDETILYGTVNQIQHSIEFIGALSAHFNIYFVTGRIDDGERRAETLCDIAQYNYKELILRPVGESHATFKLRIKKEIGALFSVGDQLTDYPDYLIPNPFYTIDAAGIEHSLLN